MHDLKNEYSTKAKEQIMRCVNCFAHYLYPDCISNNTYNKRISDTNEQLNLPPDFDFDQENRSVPNISQQAGFFMNDMNEDAFMNKEIRDMLDAIYANENRSPLHNPQSTTDPICVNESNTSTEPLPVKNERTCNGRKPKNCFILSKRNSF